MLVRLLCVHFHSNSFIVWHLLSIRLKWGSNSTKELGGDIYLFHKNSAEKSVEQRTTAPTKKVVKPNWTHWNADRSRLDCTLKRINIFFSRSVAFFLAQFTCLYPFFWCNYESLYLFRGFFSGWTTRDERVNHKPKKKKRKNENKNVGHYSLAGYSVARARFWISDRACFSGDNNNNQRKRRRRKNAEFFFFARLLCCDFSP